MGKGAGLEARTWACALKWYVRWGECAVPGGFLGGFLDSWIIALIRVYGKIMPVSGEDWAANGEKVRLSGDGTGW